ncbi:MAG: helix-turn-helix transcriptional regulator [Pseudomonadota bacterium]
MQRPFVHPPEEDLELQSVLYALADPARLAIIAKLFSNNGAMNCSAAAPADLPKSTQSHHYQVLREAGIIRSERRGTAVVNALRCEELERRFPGVLRSILMSAGVCNRAGSSTTASHGTPDAVADNSGAGSTTSR